MMAHACNPSFWGLSLAWAAEYVSGQPGLRVETLSQKHHQKQNNKKKPRNFKFPYIHSGHIYFFVRQL
jgi:hypothetical protein